MTEETLLTFPCDFPIKVMGKASDDFESQIITLIRAHAPDLKESAVRLRPSGKGNYVSVTVTVTATSKAQLDNIYLALNECEQVLMTL